MGGAGPLSAALLAVIGKRRSEIASKFVYYDSAAAPKWLSMIQRFDLPTGRQSRYGPPPGGPSRCCIRADPALADRHGGRHGAFELIELDRRAYGRSRYDGCLRLADYSKG